MKNLHQEVLVAARERGVAAVRAIFDREGVKVSVSLSATHLVWRLSPDLAYESPLFSDFFHLQVGGKVYKFSFYGGRHLDVWDKVYVTNEELCALG